MPDAKEKRSSIPFSAILVVVGILLLFGNVGWFGLDSLLNLLATWWPLIFLFRGIARMKAGSGGFGPGIRDLAFGLVMQVVMLGVLPGDIVQLWPYIFIAVGLWLIVVPGKNAILERNIDTPEFSEHILLHGAMLTVTAPRFHGGHLRATAAVVECDLSRTEEGQRVMRLEIHATLSRLRLQVSDDCRVLVEAKGGTQAVHDRRDLGNPPDSSDVPTLVITGAFTLSSLVIFDPPVAEPSPGTGTDISTR
jgi:hypothetical protein